MENFRSLAGGEYYDYNSYVPNAQWKILEELYDNFISNDDKSERIPKKIHQIWIGDMPEKQKKLIPAIIKNHPEWEYKLWTSEDLENLPMVNKDLYNSMTNLGAKSDIARYEILFREGGIYLDSDFFMIKNFNSLIHNDFFTGVGQSNEPMVFNGLIGCSKNHKLIGIILDELKKNWDGSTNLSIGTIMHFCGPYFFSKLFFDYIKNEKNEKIVVLPTPYFYSLPATERFNFQSGIDGKEEFIKSFATDKTICTHLWFTSWQ
jgi:mannosyltransferase OCH1-like enzyme